MSKWATFLSGFACGITFLTPSYSPATNSNAAGSKETPDMGDQQLTTAATWAKHQANISTREGRTKDAALWTQIAEEVDDYLAGPRPYLGLGSRVWWSVVSGPGRLLPEGLAQ